MRCVGGLAEQVLSFGFLRLALPERSFCSRPASLEGRVGVQEETHESRSRRCRRNLGWWVVVSCAASQMFPKSRRADSGVIEDCAGATCWSEYISEFCPRWFDAIWKFRCLLMTIEVNRSVNPSKVPGCAPTPE